MKSIYLSLLLLVWAGSSVAQIPTISFDEVEVGMRGEGRTVFEGSTISSFEATIIGKLPEIAPGRNLILARLSGGPLQETGVLAGMSGSPVTVDGKLIGAVAYAWGFSTEPIAGITPIDEMLDVAKRDEQRRVPIRGAFSPESAWADPLTSAFAADSFWDRRLARLQPTLGPMSTPTRLGVRGFSPAGRSRLAQRLAPLQIASMQGTASSTAGQTAALEPGSAVGVQLMRGAIELASTGTVTWVDGERVLAFGHPMFGLGQVDLPLTAARVEALLPSLNVSSRLAVTLDPIGALRQDRGAAVFGRLGAQPAMLPVRVQLQFQDRTETHSFDIAEDGLLSPLLLYIALQGLIAEGERNVGELSVQLLEGSVIKLAGEEDVAVDNHFEGSAALALATSTPAFILHLLMNSSWDAPPIAGVNLLLRVDTAPQIARVERAVTDRQQVAPGESIGLRIQLRTSKGESSSLETTIRIPEQTPAGPLDLWIGSAFDVQQSDGSEPPLLPRSSDALIRLLDRLRRNNRIYVVASRRQADALIDGVAIGSLPPSAAHRLADSAGRSDRVRTARARVAEESLPADAFVEGSVRLVVEVVR